MSEGTATQLTFGAYNLLVGGVDGDNEERRLAQLDWMSSWSPDCLWVTEATGWHRDDGARFEELAERTGLAFLPPIATHVGDGYNQSVLYYRADLMHVVRSGPGAVGSFHHGWMRAQFDVDGTPFLFLGTHLAYASGAARLAEAHHLADYGSRFGSWPEDGVLLGDMNCADDTDLKPDEWGAIPLNLQHRYRPVLADGTFGDDYDRSPRRLLLNSGWRDPQGDVPAVREPTTGYWYDNEQVPMRLDQAFVTGDRVEVVDYRTHVDPELDRLSDHRPIELVIRLHPAATPTAA
ncbi:endonuclease/exonuclease/phosphatase family protein [Streptomyces sp. CAU 1734]|uniref:endonuclease/exonuclease/phosphatase family protein n=1 Tax=Streptomyces sp. CAU 1734 TaxID=3140360 RepID=UPI0032606924